MRARKHKTKKIAIPALVIVVLLVGVFLGWKYYHRPGPTHKNVSTKINSVNYGPPTQAEKQAGEQIKKQNIQNSTSSSTPPVSSTPSTTISISRLDQASPGQDVNLRTVLTNDVSNGQCVATFTQTGQTSVTETAGIASNPTYFSCEPIDASLSTGTWQVTTYVEQGGSVVSNKATGSVVVQ